MGFFALTVLLMGLAEVKGANEENVCAPVLKSHFMHFEYLAEVS